MHLRRSVDNRGRMESTRIKLDPQAIEAIARRVVEILERQGMQQPELVDATELARRFGIERSWVYSHAIELGAVKLGSGLYASVRFALGDDPVYVAAQLGHTEPGFSMKVYASAVRRRERLIGAALREFDAALEWAAMGSGGRVGTDSEPNGSGGQSPGLAQQSLFAASSPDSSAG